MTRDFFSLKKQGEEICVALQTHINDVMLRRYSKARSTAGSAPANADVSSNPKPSNVDVSEKRADDLSKALEESQKTAKQVSNLIRFLFCLFHPFYLFDPLEIEYNPIDPFINE